MEGHKVGELVLFRLEGAPPVFAEVRVVTDDETYPYILRTLEGHPHVALAGEVTAVHISKEQTS